MLEYRFSDYTLPLFLSYSDDYDNITFQKKRIF